jgi:hypothetical protein
VGTIAAGGSAYLINMCTLADVAVLVLPSTSTTTVTLLQDWSKAPSAALPDAVYLFSPADLSNFATKVDIPPYTYSYAVTAKPTAKFAPLETQTPTITFRMTTVCEAWYNDCYSQETAAGVQSLPCTGFKKFPAQCQAWCADFPDECDAAKQRLCNPGNAASGSSTHLYAPECACMLGAASRVTLPETLGLTYQRYYNLLNNIPNLATHLPHPLCWFPPCIRTDAVTTSAMREVKATQCPVDIEICLALGGNLSIDAGAQDRIDFVNRCGQSLGEDPHLESLPAEDPSGPGGHGGGGGDEPAPGPTQPDVPWYTTQAFVIGVSVAAAVVILIIVLSIALTRGGGGGKK